MDNWLLGLIIGIPVGVTVYAIASSGADWAVHFRAPSQDSREPDLFRIFANKENAREFSAKIDAQGYNVLSITAVDKG